MEIDYHKNWGNLTISNNFLFSKLMRDEEICKEVIELLLDIKVGSIKYLEEQKVTDIVYRQKSIRLDVDVEDEKRHIILKCKYQRKKS